MRTDLMYQMESSQSAAKNRMGMLIESRLTLGRWQRVDLVCHGTYLERVAKVFVNKNKVSSIQEPASHKLNDSP